MNRKLFRERMTRRVRFIITSSLFTRFNTSERKNGVCANNAAISHVPVYFSKFIDVLWRIPTVVPLMQRTEHSGIARGSRTRPMNEMQPRTSIIKKNQSSIIFHIILFILASEYFILRKLKANPCSSTGTEAFRSFIEQKNREVGRDKLEQ